MSNLKHLGILEAGHEVVIAEVVQRLDRLGLITTASFDLQAAKAAHGDTVCPYHGSVHCDCQIVVLLVYGEQEAPVTLVVDSRDGKTFLSMLEPPPGGPEWEIAGQIVEELGPASNQRYRVVESPS
jgi:hypothetical protein